MLPSLAERRRPVCLSSDHSSSFCPTHSLLSTAPVPPLALLFVLHYPIFPIVSASHHAYSLRSLWGAMSLRHGCFFSTSAVAIVPPPGHRQGLAPRLGAPCTPEASAHGTAGRHGQDDLVFLTRQHTMALPVSTAWPGHRPLLHGAASAGRGGVPSSPNHRSRPVFFTPAPVPTVSLPPTGVGGADGLFMWHEAAEAMQLALQRALDPRSLLSSGTTDGSSGALGVPVSPSPPLGMPASHKGADDIDVVAPRRPAEQDILFHA